MATRDVFLSYHSSDRATVQAVKSYVQGRGITTFLDRDDLVPGIPWPQALEQALASVRAVAVFLGRAGLGLWQKRELWLALDRQVQEERAGRAFAVIPVLLPGADPMPGFLFLNTWVDLRRDPTDADNLDTLFRAIRGESPAADGAPPVEPPVALCPYRGLRAFREEDAALFFGRDAFTDRLAQAVQRRNLVTVVGPSGSGKSSVVQAGLLPRLRRQAPPATSWDAATFTPGDRPFHRLAAALMPLLEPDLHETDRLTEIKKLGDRLAAQEVCLEDVVERLLARSGGTDRLLLVVDQCEELFTLTPLDIRRPLVETLLNALTRAPLTLVLTLRADFYGHALALSRELSDALEGGVVNLGPMTREELRQAIVEPARRVGLTFEPGLAEAILDDVGDEPGNLPLLEFALAELWARRQNGCLTHAAYEAIGRVAGAIAQRAETEFGKLSAEQQRIAEKVFTRLVRVARPEERAEDTRRRCPLEELVGQGEGARAVVQALADARLLVTGRDDATGTDTVEVAHEALIRGWARLRGWLDTDREFLLWRQRLRSALEDWQRLGEDEGALLRGAPLAEAEHWLAAHPGDLTDNERGYIRNSIAQRELEEQRWRQLGRLARARELAVQSELVRGRSGKSLLCSVLLAVESVQLAHTPQGTQVLSRGLDLLPRPIARLEHTDSVGIVTFSPDGRLLATASEDGTIRVWNLDSDQELVCFQHEGSVTAVVFEPAGNLLATAGDDHTARLWSIASRCESGCMYHDTPVTTLSFSPNSRWLATVCDSHLVRVWQMPRCRPAGCMEHTGAVLALAFGPTGRWIATGSEDGAIVIWECTTGRVLYRLECGSKVCAIAFSGNSQTLAVAGQDQVVRAWMLPQENELVSTVAEFPIQPSERRELMRVKSDSPVRVITLSADGKRMAVGNLFNKMTVYDVAVGQTTSQVRYEAKGSAKAVAFSSDSDWLATALGDTARVWWATTSGEVIRAQHEGPVNAIAFDPDGKWLATGSKDRTARVWRVPGGADITRVEHDPLVRAVSFSPDGRQLATGSWDGTARIWDVHTGHEMSRLQHEGTVAGVDFSPDGQFLATGNLGGMARIWELATCREVARMAYEVGAWDVAFSPDGRRLATGNWDGSVLIWDVVTGEILNRLSHACEVFSVVFSPDGRWLATASDDFTARI